MLRALRHVACKDGEGEEIKVKFGGNNGEVYAEVATTRLLWALEEERIDAPDANQVQVVFGSVAFADWLAWIASLQTQHIRLDSSRIEALSTPGLVGVTATFVRAK